MERRKFIEAIGVLSAGGLLTQAIANAGPLLVQPRFKIGFAAIAWNGQDRQAIEDVHSLGYHGIQLRGSAFKTFSPSQELIDKLRTILSDTAITVPIFSGGNQNPGPEADSQLQIHEKQMAFCQAIGVKYYQITNNARPKDGSKPSKELLKAFCEELHKVAAMATRYELHLVYHNHMHQLGETPEEVDYILENTDGQKVGFLLDVGHYHQGGGDPVKAIRKYQKRIKALHLKDTKPDATAKNGYKFVELGQGKVDVKGVLKALDQIGFDGWAMVELDAVPEPNRTPLESAQISHTYLLDKLGYDCR